MPLDARRIALAASILALALTPLAFCLAPLLAQRVYVDEHGLLAGQAAEPGLRPWLRRTTN